MEVYLKNLKWAEYKTGNKEEALDIAQQAYLRLLSYKKELNNPEAFFTHVVNYEILNYYKNKKKKALLIDDLIQTDYSSDDKLEYIASRTSYFDSPCTSYDKQYQDTLKRFKDVKWPENGPKMGHKIKQVLDFYKTGKFKEIHAFYTSKKYRKSRVKDPKIIPISLEACSTFEKTKTFKTKHGEIRRYNYTVLQKGRSKKLHYIFKQV